MKSQIQHAWSAFYFSVSLCAIVLISNLRVNSIGGTTDACLPVFLCFLPIGFLIVAKSLSDSHKHIETLEARIQELQAVKN